MEKNSVLIIGCGWLGTALGKDLSAKGYRVYGSVTRKENFSRLEGAGIFPFLLRLGNRPEDHAHAIPDSGIAIILLNPRIIQANLGELTQALTNSGVRHVFLASSTAVYPSSNSRVTEADAIEQDSPHSGVNMLRLEKAIEKHFPTTIMRFAGLYGPGRHPGNFFRETRGGALNPVNVIHLDDCIRAVHKLIIAAPSGAFNLCADQHPARVDFYTSASKAIGLTPPLFGNEEIPYKIVDNTLFKESIGFRYKHSDPMKDFVT